MKKKMQVSPKKKKCKKNARKSENEQKKMLSSLEAANCKIVELFRVFFIFGKNT